MDSTAERLTQFGLSETEARTYLAVLERGTATVATVSEATDISTGYVYDLVECLEDRGFVVVDDHRTPTQIRAIDPESAIESMTEELTDLESDLTDRYTDTERDYPGIELVRARQTLYRRLERLIDEAEDEIFMMLPVVVAERLSDPLRRARDRGVFIALLLGDGEETSTVENAAEIATVVRSWEPSVETLVTVDDTSAVTSDSSLLRGEHRDGDYSLVLEQSPKTAGAITSQWFNFWAAGDEVVSANPPELPAENLPFRHGLFTIVKHAEERDLLVTAHLFPGQGHQTLTGTVVSVNQSLLEPVTADFPVQNTLTLDIDGEEVSIGGAGAFVEDYSAKTLSIREQ
ncbi:TrmB family transcriptional regulator sugar-binding domain-containing protein [Haloarcula amylovorans]|uniref:TrmB family transcriptional regulator sugar-binding domain-containing protein n=1 Tax=Haloarcula amylovorans TaxID=2562280 RepID=UPI0010761D2E|nr:TrmB family transcriptional regulator sugar-binding domain-containing protein [Halomicroarcula amylolytica]